jgi:TetR/AcrR family transcriptional repressor of nem operon
MRRSRADKATTHSKILAVAAKRFRERGLDGIGVADVMKEAGSSVGGFYKHFNSRDELVVEALAEAFKFLERIESQAEDLPSYFAMFLSDEHRDNPGTGCALTALATDVRNASTAVRTVYTQRVKQNLTHYSSQLSQGDAHTRRSRAILLLSAAMGGVALSRAVNDPALSREILEALRTEVEALISSPKVRKTAAKKSKNK